MTLHVPCRKRRSMTMKVTLYDKVGNIIIQCKEREREQRNKSLHSNAMSRCNSYKLINEKYSVKVANYE